MYFSKYKIIIICYVIFVVLISIINVIKYNLKTNQLEINMENKDDNKNMALLYYNLYISCVKYNYKYKETNCQKYYEELKKYAIKYVMKKK